MDQLSNEELTMHNEDRFFMRDPWEYEPDAEGKRRSDAELGFDTRALHAGFDPLESVEGFRSFVPPIVQSVTYPY